MASAPSFIMVIERVTRDETAATLDLKHPKTRAAKEVSDLELKKRGAWFAGLNDEYGADGAIRVAIYGDDGQRFKPGQRVRVTIEPVERGRRG